MFNTGSEIGKTGVIPVSVLTIQPETIHFYPRRVVLLCCGDISHITAEFCPFSPAYYIASFLTGRSLGPGGSLARQFALPCNVLTVYGHHFCNSSFAC
jgi:hypothetical protein